MLIRTPIRSRKLLSLAAIVVAVVAVCAGESRAAINMPEPVGFDADDLEDSLSGDSAADETSSTDRTDAPLPFNEEDDSAPNPLGLLNSTLPSGGNSSSGTSSTSTGGVGTSAIAIVLTNAPEFGDDPAIGAIVESRRLSLPDAPSNELLRPPQAG